ncbi:MAG: DUF1295 domain-containing protein [Cyclobacteriaceae bacterium]|nr:DUF1295 domain-containing protein [Cyclobacteriaceae bacterium HetDA_MAG_MS6]
MPLLEEMESQGSFLFRHRGILPILMLGAGVLVFRFTYESRFLVTLIPFSSWCYICLGVSLFGLMVRMYTVGHTAFKSSGRNTDGQLAHSLNTSGIYSIVRHPLYVGNFFMWFGIGLLAGNIWFIALFTTVYWLYYERIMLAEEKFLKEKFGSTYIQWAQKTPAFVPAVNRWKPGERRFSWKKVINKEKNGVLALFLVMYLFVILEEWLRNDTLPLTTNLWSVLLGLATCYYLVVKIINKTSGFLDESER